MRKITRIMGMVFMTLGLGACSGCSHMNVEKGDERPFESPLPVNVKPKRMAIGHAVVVAVKVDGTMWAWGQAFEGEMGLGQAHSSSTVPVRIPDLTEFIEVAGMESHFLARRKDGSVWSWGQNDKGELGYETTPDKWRKNYNSTPAKIEGMQNIISVAAGGGHSLALTATGDVYAWGDNSAGQVDPELPLDEAVVMPRKVASIKDGVRVVAGLDNSGVITSQGDIYIWGGNSFGKSLSNPPALMRLPGEAPKVELKRIPKSPDYQGVSDFHSMISSYLLMRNGLIRSAGGNSAGVLGIGHRKQSPGINQVRTIGRVKSLSARSGGVALDEQGRVWQWGPSVVEPPTELSRTDSLSPVSIVGFKNAIEVYAGEGVIAVLLDDGSVYMWGSGKNGKLGSGESNVEHKYWAKPTKTLWTWK